MGSQSRGWRKLFKPRKEIIDSHQKGLYPGAKNLYSSLSPAKDTGASCDNVQTWKENQSNNQKAKATSESGQVSPRALSTLQSPVSQAEQNLQKPKPSEHKPLTTLLSTGSNAVDDRPLWDRAYARLRDQKLEIVEAYESILANTADIKPGLPLNERMRAVIDTKIRVITSRHWKLRIPFRKDQVLVTKIVDKVVGVVLRFKSSGSIAANADPVHLITNASEERKSSLEGLELVADLVDLYAEVENGYLSQIESRLTKKFSEKLEHLYFEILDFLARAACFFDLSTTKRLTVEVLKREDWDGKLKSIKLADEDCRNFANAVYQQEHRDGLMTISNLIRQQEASIQELLQNLKVQWSKNEEIISWVSGIKVESAHGQIRSKLGSRYQNTGQWLRSRYRAWRESSEPPTFWICGSVGTGKSSLISHVIEWHLEETPASETERVVYYYCSGKEGQSTNSEAVLRSLIAQLAWSPDGSQVASSVTALHENKNRKQDQFSPELLADLAAPYEQITIILDALDECQDYSKLLFLLKNAYHNSSGKFKFVFASRLNVNLLSDFPSWAKLELDAKKDLTSEDMEAYIRTQVMNPEGRRLLDGNNSDMEEKLVETLTFRAQGMFRWVELQLVKFLSDHSGLSNSEDVEEALNRLSNEVGDPDLDKVYSEIYEMNTRAASKSRAIAVRAFHWMMCTQRPLSITELAAGAVAGQSERMKMEGDDEYILKICGNFIVADTSKIAEFAHLSVREYLQKREIDGIREYAQERSHNLVAQTCLLYLLDPPIPLSNIDQFDDSLLGYSVVYWAFHWEQASERRGPSSLGKLYMEFIPYTKSSSLFIDWIDVLPNAALHLWVFSELSRRLGESKSPVLAACVWGFTEILVNLSRVPGSVFMDSFQEEPQLGLTIACFYGQDDVVQLLLDHGVPATGNALFAASNAEHWNIVKQLLDSNVADAIDKQGRTPLHEVGWREETHCVAVTRFLLEYGAHPGKLDECGQTPLHVTVSPQIVQLLLENGADVNAKDKAQCTPLHEAIDSEIVQLFLENGADVEAKDEYQQTPLHGAACRRRSVGVARVLLDKGADFLAKDDKIQAPLHKACGDCNEETIQLLLEKGADANSNDSDGRTALHISAMKGHQEGVRLLLNQSGIEANSRDKDGLTPLSLATHNAKYVFEKRDKVVQLLVHGGGDCDAQRMNQSLWDAVSYGTEDLLERLLHTRIISVDEKDQCNNGGTLLHRATSKGYKSSIGLLIEREANIEAEDDDKCTALHIAVSYGYLQIVRLFLDKGASVEARNKHGETPLIFAFVKALEPDRELDTAIIDLLLENGANINCTDNNQQTALHLASHFYDEALVRYLLRNGADISLRDQNGDTALHIAAGRLGEEMLPTVRLLIKHGADKMARNEKGKTPLDGASLFNRRELEDIFGMKYEGSESDSDDSE